MYNKTLKLGLLIIVIGLCASCKLNGQNDNGKHQRKERPSIEELFEHMDANEDGKLSKEEIKGPLKNDFDKIDTNEDGFLSKKEIEDAPKPERGQGRPQR